MKVPHGILSEPYRLFFPLGWLMGIVGTSYWLFVSMGLSAWYAPLYHGLIQIQLFCFAFALGFLLTALPKFLRTRPASSGEFNCLLATYVLLAVALLGNAVFWGQWIFVILFALMIRFVVLRVNERKAMAPFSFVLVGFGLAQGMAGALLINYPLDALPLLGQRLVEQGLFLNLSLGVGSFLGPRLMGVVDTVNAVVSLPGKGAGAVPWHKSPLVAVVVIGLLITVSFLIESAGERTLGLYLRAGASLLCLARFNVLSMPRSQSVVGVLVALALWSMPLGILGAAFFPHHEVGALHLTYLGGFGLLILAIGAQVTTSHGGVPHFWQIHKTGAVCVTVLVASSAVLRASATMVPEHYFPLLGAAAFCFDLALISWGLGVLRHMGSGIRSTAAGA